MSRMINVLVVDDEPLARDSIKVLLGKLSDVNLMGEASDGASALALIDQLKPDLVFLDIQMPVMTGIELARLLSQGPHIIFTTAYDQYALEAFEVQAIDYLLKPFDDERFFKALGKARERINSQQLPDYTQLMQLLDTQPDKYLDKVIIRDPGRIRILHLDEVCWIGGAGNYVELHLFEKGKSVLHRDTMTSMEEKLDPKVFIRIHRSSIVRISEVCELRPNDKGDYSVWLKNGEKLTLSRRHKHKFQDILGQS